MTRPRLPAREYIAGVRRGDRVMLGRAITLMESTRPDDAALAEEVLEALLPHTGGARRAGISGSPGVGKSTFIETLGLHLIGQGRRVAVLAVDPSSAVSGGSILADKSRMSRLAASEHAFIRPSPSAGTLGGVALRTREALLLCEAAGYDVVLVETVGVGQSETAVADLVDCFLVLLLPGAGDELQAIKRGIIELADLLAVNKADGDNVARATQAMGEYAAALRYLQPRSAAWRPRVLALSARTGAGIAELWDQVEAHRRALEAHGELHARRREQAVRWLWTLLEHHLRAAFLAHPEVAARIGEVERAVAAGTLGVARAARDLLARFRAAH